jgi:hypothetical protein
MRAGRVVAVVVACAALAGCGALLDLDVHYVGPDGSVESDGGVGVDAGAQDAPGPDAASDDDAAPGTDTGTPDRTAPDAAEASTTGPDADSGATPDDGSTDDGSGEAASPDGGGPAYVQGTAVAVSKTGMSASLSFDNDVQDHDAIVVAVDFQTTPGLRVTDSLGNMFQPALSPIPNTGTTCAIYYALDVQGGADTVTVSTMPGNSNSFELYIHEYSGIAGLDGASGNTGMTALMESGFVTTTAPNDLVFGFGVTGGATSGTGFTLRSALDSNVTEDEIAAAPGPHEATARTQAGAGWTMLMAAFVAQ